MKRWSCGLVTVGLFWLFLSLAACSQPADLSVLEEKGFSLLDPAAVYSAFLAGETTALDEEGTARTVEECMLYGNLREDYTYALTDLNGDAVAELCIRKLDTLYVFTVAGGSLRYVEGLSYTTVLENGGLLYRRDGGAPTHTDYQYFQMDADGQVSCITSFSWYEGSTVAEGEESPERYFVDEVEVTQAVYEETADRYLNRQSIVWLNEDGSPAV